MLELLVSLVRRAYQSQQLAVFLSPTNEVSHLLSEFGVKLIEQNEKITHLTLTDQLTGIYNRRAFEDFGNKEFYRSRRFNQAFSTLMVDIDHFKSINDTYGHQAGDDVLVAFTKAWQSNLRQSDIFSRIGGEEFVTVLPNTSETDAEKLANRLKESIADLKITPSCLNHPISTPYQSEFPR